MPANRSSRARTWLLGLIVSIVGLVLALIMGEVVLRLLGFESKLVYRPNPFYGWSHNARDRFSRVVDGGEIEISINSRGLRDYEYPYERSPGSYRILVLGDSFTEAFQVALEDSFPKVLEGELQSRYSGRPTVEVIGAGVSGFGTDNELLFYRHEGFRYKPDLVMVAFYIGNDVRNNWYELDVRDSGELRKPYFVIEDGELAIQEYPFERHTSLETRFKVFLNRNVLMYSMLREVRDQLRHRRRPGRRRNGVPMDSYLFAEEYSPEWENAWAVTKGIILTLRDEVADDGAELLVVMIPTRFQVHPAAWRERLQRSSAMRQGSWDLDKPNAILTRFLRDEGVLYLDLLPVLRARSEHSDHEFYIPEDGHWNPAGHALSAELIAGKLEAVLPAAVLGPDD